MSGRKYSKCEWCGRTIDVTNSDRELCETCAEYPNKQAMIKAESTCNIKEIKFGNPTAEAYLKGLRVDKHMFTLRSDNEANRIGLGIKKVNNSDMSVRVLKIEETVKICRIKGLLHVSMGSLEPYVKRSGFGSVRLWLRALDEYLSKIPECRGDTEDGRDFHVLRVIKRGDLTP